MSMMTKFSSSSWNVAVAVDGEILSSTLWRNPAVPFVKEFHVTEEPGGILSEGLLTFGARVSVVWHSYEATHEHFRKQLLETIWSP